MIKRRVRNALAVRSLLMKRRVRDTPIEVSHQLVSPEWPNGDYENAARLFAIGCAKRMSGTGRAETSESSFFRFRLGLANETAISKGFADTPPQTNH